MDICPPAIVTAAAFVAVIFLDLSTHEWGRVPGHGLLGVFATLLMIFICQRGSQTMAWILFGAPIVFVLIAWILRAYSEIDRYDETPQQSAPWDGGGCPCPCCGSMPCSCMRACQQAPRCVPKPKSKCRPKNPPCSEDSYFELWLTTK